MEEHKDLNALNALRKKIKSESQSRYADESKKRLAKIITTKIRTSFIGSLSAFEEAFGFIWGHESGQDLTEEQEYMKQVWENTRTSILNNGNNQIRAAQNEILNHDVHWNRYQMTLPVKPVDNHKEEK